MHCSYIVQTIGEDLTYDYLHSSEDNLWSILRGNPMKYL